MPIYNNLNTQINNKKKYIYLKKISKINFRIQEVSLNKLNLVNLNRNTDLFVSESRIKKNNKNPLFFSEHFKKLILIKQKKKIKTIKTNYIKKNKITK